MEFIDIESLARNNPVLEHVAREIDKHLATTGLYINPFWKTDGPTNEARNVALVAILAFNDYYNKVRANEELRES